MFREGQIGVDEYIVQKSRFRLHYESVLCRTQKKKQRKCHEENKYRADPTVFVE